MTFDDNFLKHINSFFTIAPPVFAFLFFIYLLILRSKSIYKWRDINRGIVKLSEEIKNKAFPDIIIGNGVICNLMDDLFDGSEAIKLVEVDEKDYLANKEMIDKHFLVAHSELWYHLIPKYTLELYKKGNPSPKILIFLNYIGTGEAYKNIKIELSKHFREEDIKIASLFRVKEFERPHLKNGLSAGGKQIPVDFVWKSIRSSKTTYLPWGNVSKSKRRYEFDQHKKAYLAYKRKLLYYYREHTVHKSKTLKRLFGSNKP